MAVLEVREIHNGRDGEDRLNRDGRQVLRYSRVFRVATSSNFDDGRIVKRSASLPRVGSQHNTDATAFCRSVRARNESFSKRVWLVTCLYSTEREVNEDPLAEPAEISWSTQVASRPFEKDIEGKPIENSAGDRFDPLPEDDDSYWVASVKKNVPAVPIWFLEYRIVQNDADFILDGVEVLRGQARLVRIAITAEQERNDIRFRVLTMTIGLKEEGWKASIHDVGLNAIDATGKKVPALNEDGTRSQVPQSLDGKGAQLKKGAEREFLEFDLRPEKDFKVLPLA